MKLIIAASIEKVEYSKTRVPLDALKLAARKCCDGLGINIKNPRGGAGTLLRKLSITTSGGAARALFLLLITKKDAVLVMIRLKNDKQVGQNMALVNPKFKTVLQKNLGLITQDIKAGKYTEHEIGT